VLNWYHFRNGLLSARDQVPEINLRRSRLHDPHKIQRQNEMALHSHHEKQMQRETILLWESSGMFAQAQSRARGARPRSSQAEWSDGHHHKKRKMNRVDFCNKLLPVKSGVIT
jgi:hypothetical protein